MRRREATMTALAATLVLMTMTVTGCAEQAAPGESAEGEVAAEAVTAPHPLLALTCDELIDPALVQDVLGAVTAGFDPVMVPGGIWPLSAIAIRQGGSLDCYWGDDAALQGPYARYLKVNVLPNAADAWLEQEPVLASWSQPFADHGEAGYSNCSDSADYRNCKYDLLVGTNWLHAEVMNVDALEDAAPVIRALTDAVAAAEPATQTWTAPATSTLPASCADWLPQAGIEAAVGMEGVAEREFPLMMPIVFNTAFHNGLACSWSNSYSSAQAMPVGAVALPAAAWAWEEAWAKPRPDRAPATSLAGLGDQAYVGCATDSNNCFVDVLVGDVWIVVDGNKQAGLEALQQIAATAIAHFTA